MALKSDLQPPLQSSTGVPAPLHTVSSSQCAFKAAASQIKAHLNS